MTTATQVRKQSFRFAALQGSTTSIVKPGDTGSDVRALQTFLTAAGYLGRDRQPGHFCHCTGNALRHFQKCYGLPDTGAADPETLGLIQQPRCGVADISPGSSTHGPAPFVLRGCKYNRTDLTYALINGTSDLPGGHEQVLIREAFAAWAAVTPLRFTEVAPQQAPTFTVAWEQGGHGDGSPFDQGGSIQGNVLAHAFYPPPCGGPFAGALHFDEFERWTDAAAAGAIRLRNVAIHEIGHLLGLDHSNERNAIMFAFYDDAVDGLRQDDINGIQALYGQAPGPVPRPGAVPIIRGSLSRTGQNQVHQISTQPGPLRVTLRGPAGQDFDLYVRAGMAPTRRRFDARSFSPLPDEEVQIEVSGGEVFILVDSWRGSGAYEVQVAVA